MKFLLTLSFAMDIIKSKFRGCLEIFFESKEPYDSHWSKRIIILREHYEKNLNQCEQDCWKIGKTTVASETWSLILANNWIFSNEITKFLYLRSQIDFLRTNYAQRALILFLVCAENIFLFFLKFRHWNS